MPLVMVQLYVVAPDGGLTTVADAVVPATTLAGVLTVRTVLVAALMVWDAVATQFVGLVTVTL